MTVYVDWTDENRSVLLMTIEEGWTWALFFECQEQAAEMVYMVDHSVSLIIDYKDTVPPRAILTYFPLMQKSPLYTCPNLVQIILVGSPNFQQSLLPIMARMTSHTSEIMTAASTLEEAFMFIQLG